ncbi:MAG: 16S rRNA (guanine(966)-N(2))-methyltransferase RsmD [Desulfobacteraceae bacterium]
MRVISGRIKGHRLKSLEGSTVRPTADRIKEAMFNILADKPNGAKVLDLFAGSGALGIEAISRGAQTAVFVDGNTQAIKVLRQNLNHCRIDHNAEVIQWDIEKNLNCLKTSVHKFNLIFMDPPYRRCLVEIALRQLLSIDCMAQDVLIVAEHESGCRINIPQSPLRLTDSRRYGSTQLSFFGLHP